MTAAARKCRERERKRYGQVLYTVAINEIDVTENAGDALAS